MKYFDAFSGYGGFSLGIQKAYVDSTSRSKERGSQEDTERNKGQRFQSEEGEDTATQDGRDSEHDRDISDERQPHCVGYSEIDKYATAIYQKHFPYEECESCRLRRVQSDDSQRPGELDHTQNQLEQRELSTHCQCKHKPYGDITKLDPTTLPDFDLFVGGVPCQSWSIAGKRGGFEDERGNMWFQFTKILRAKRPKYFLAENVKGLLSHDGGKSMERICEELCDCGYAIDFEVLNSKNFGVPQNRERVFIIGVRLDFLDECQIF